MPTLADVGEREVLRRLIAARSAASGVVVGPGDDAAVLAPSPGMELVATTDAFVEGRHFLPEWMDAETAGARLAAANLSDLAAMAARPRWALLSMGLRRDHDLDTLLAFQAGVARRLEPWAAGIVGGNLTAVDGAEWFDLTLLGEVALGGAWTRSGARPGDLLAITGFPGRSAAGHRLAEALQENARAERWQPLLEAWRRPSPRVSFALAAVATGAVRGAIDVSDGVAGDLERLCVESRVGLELDDRAWRDDPLLAAAASELAIAPEDLRLGPSDDYELLLAVDPGLERQCRQVAAAERVPLSFVGRFTAEKELVRITSAGRQALSGRTYDHFRADRPL